jgi:hypothetical protein
MPPVEQLLRQGRYALLGSLGEGSQGRTYDAVDKREGQAVAIKRFDVRGAASWKDVDLAEREARVLQQLSHPRLPRYVDRFEEDGALYLVMEKIEGENLAVMRKRGQLLDEKGVLRLLQDASEVLDYLHGRSPPVIHRDLKPGNVLRRPDGSFAFVDFGAVRDKLRPEGGSTIVGTFGYMAPEQFQGRALPGSDVYAIAATALTLLTGRDPEDLPHKGLGIDVRAALRGTRVGERTTSLLERMLDPDPDRRASRIAPLLERAGRGERREAGAARATGRNASRQAPPEVDPREVHRDRARRYAERITRREVRRAQRAARRNARWRSGPPLPLSLLFGLLSFVAMLAVTIATQIAVPLVLTLLSIVVAPRAMRRAADSVRKAGHRALEQIQNAQRQARAARDPAPAPQPKARVEPDEGGARVRVEDEGERDEETDEDLEERAGPGRGAGRRG